MISGTEEKMIASLLPGSAFPHLFYQQTWNLTMLIDGLEKYSSEGFLFGSNMRHDDEAASQKCKHGLPPQCSLKFPSWVAINNVKKVGQ